MRDSLLQPGLCRSAWQPNINIDGKRMFCNPFPVFMCVRCDRQLTFVELVRKLCQSMSGRFKLLRALGGTTWGWPSSDCRQDYMAIVRSMPEYAAATWANWLSTTSNNKLEKVQLEAATAITGLVRYTLVEAVLAESMLLPISTRLQTISLLKADERANLPPADDRRQILLTACRQRLKRKDRRNAQHSTRILVAQDHTHSDNCL